MMAPDDRVAIRASGDLFADWQVGTETVHLFPCAEVLSHQFGPGEATAPLVELLRLIHPTDLSTLLQALSLSIAARVPFRAEVRVIASGAGVRCFLARGRITGGVAGEARRVFAAFTDVTREYELRAHLSERAESFEVAEEIAGIGTWEYDIITDKGTFDASLCRILGVPTANVDFADFLEKVHTDDRPMIQRAFMLAVTEGRPYTVQLRIRGPRGFRWHEARASVDRDASGRPIRVRGVDVDIDERKRQQRALEVYTDVVRQSPVGLFVWGFGDVNDLESLRVLAINAAGAKLSGRTADECLGKSMRELFPRLLDTDFPSTCQEAVLNGTTHEVFAFPYSDPRVGKRIFSTRVFPLPENAVGVFFEDLTEQAQAFEALSESEERFRRFAEETNDVFWFMEVSPPRFLYVSPSSVRLSGLRPEEAYADPAGWFRVIHADDFERVISTFVAAARRGMRKSTEFSVEFRVLHGPSDVRWVRSRGVVTPGGPKGKARASGIAEDITWQKHAEASLKLLADVSAALGATLDSRQALQRVCELAVPVLADGLAIDVTDLGQVERLGAAGVAKDAADGDRDGEGDAKEELPILIRNERSGTLSLYYRTPRRADASDLTIAEELARRTAAALDNALHYRGAQAAVRVRDEFLSVASHELRTPLATLQIAVQRLKNPAEDTPPDRQFRTVEIAERQVARLSALVDDLLNVARIQEGSLALNRSDVDLVALVERVVRRMKPIAERAGSTLELRAERDVHGQWDEVWLDYVLSGILSNAVKFGAQRPIRVLVGGGDAWARLRIEDAGIGISRERLPFVFDRFARAVSTHEYGGLGLGLYIVRGVVAAHGGAIRVESELGKGSAFTIELPLDHAAQ